MNKLLINKSGAMTVKDFSNAKRDFENQEITLNKIFKDKAPNYTEIEVSFFQLCDLHCKFCWQDSYDPVGITTIEQKAETVVDYLIKEEENLRDTIQVHLLGGELFEDSNNYYEQYLSFIRRISDYCIKELPHKKLLFVFLTNMNFQKDLTLNRLELFLNTLQNEKISFILTTSWDPTGRPLKGEVNTKFHQNITHFKEHLSEITFVLTRPTIKRLLKDENEYLDLLVSQGFTIDFDYYMPTTNASSLMPSDWELLNAFRYMIKKYPHIRKLKSWTQEINAPSKLTCASLSKITILPDGTITNCRHLDYSQKDFNTDIINESNSSMIFEFISKKECLSCTYFNNCPLSCFLMSDSKYFSSNKELDTCFYKTLFNEKYEQPQ
jgi:radical SAM protein with 4Fe4S-binding SPASM domain